MSEHVLNEESRRKSKEPVSSDKGTALIAAATASGSARNNRRVYTPGVSCAYCRMKNHDHTQCYKLNGYPSDHKLYDPHFVKPSWQPPNRHANTASSEDASWQSPNRHANTASSEGVSSSYEPRDHHGWTATIVDDHRDELANGDTVALHASGTADGTHQWTLDTGASSHFCNDRTLFDTFTASHHVVRVAAGKSFAALGTGTIVINFKRPDGTVQTVTLRDVVYVPEMYGNLLSLGRLAARGTKTELSTAGCKLIAPDNTVLAHTTLASDKLYRLTARAQHRTAVDIAVVATVSTVHVIQCFTRARSSPFQHAPRAGPSCECRACVSPRHVARGAILSSECPRLASASRCERSR